MAVPVSVLCELSDHGFFSCYLAHQKRRRHRAYGAAVSPHYMAAQVAEKLDDLVDALDCASLVAAEIIGRDPLGNRVQFEDQIADLPVEKRVADSIGRLAAAALFA